MAQSHPAPSSPPAGALWLYGLPGSGVPYTKAAGAPPLAELECLEPVGAEEQGARVCICYGSLLLGMEELVEQLTTTPSVLELEAALEGWEADLAKAAALKRRWREKLFLLNLSQGGAALDIVLAREVPELVGCQRQEATPAAALLELALRALLQRQPGLVNAWLDVEHWADAPGGEVVDWRRPMDLARWQEAVLFGESALGAGGAAQDRCAELEQLLLQEQERGAMLQRYLVAMERELDHYAGVQERVVTLASDLPELLGRVRRVLHGQRAGDGREWQP